MVLCRIKWCENVCFLSAAFIPGPLSRKWISMIPAAVARVQICIRRSASDVDAIASIAFIIRFSKTCCNCTGSPRTAGRLSARSVSTVTRRSINWWRNKAVVEPTSWLKSTDSNLFSPFLSRPRSR